jgi:hypothetical protein
VQAATALSILTKLAAERRTQETPIYYSAHYYKKCRRAYFLCNMEHTSEHSRNLLTSENVNVKSAGHSCFGGVHFAALPFGTFQPTPIQLHQSGRCDTPELIIKSLIRRLLRQSSGKIAKADAPLWHMHTTQHQNAYANRLTD